MLKQDLSLKEDEVRGLLDKGSKFIHEASPTEETRAIKEALSNLQREWTQLREVVGEREDKIGAASSQAQQFKQNGDKMSWWLGTAEERLKKVTPESLDKASIAEKLKELQVAATVFFFFHPKIY